MPIYSKLRGVRFAREEREGTKLTYETLQKETGLASSTLARLMSREPIDRIDGRTIEVLCGFFRVGVGDLLEFVPAGTAHTNEDMVMPTAAELAEEQQFQAWWESLSPERQEQERAASLRAIADVEAGRTIPLEQSTTNTRAEGRRRIHQLKEAA